jgi:transposase
LIDGIRWRTRVGAPWRDVPERYGHWESIYGPFRRWQREKVWALVWSTLLAWADTGGVIRWDVSVDSTINRAHQHAAGARRHPGEQVAPPGDEPLDHALGRSRGGWTTRIHLACEQGRRPLAALLTAGQRGDSPQFIPVLEAIRVPRLGCGRPRTRPDRALADKAYSSRANRAYLRRRKIAATIAVKRGRGHYHSLLSPRRRQTQSSAKPAARKHLPRTYRFQPVGLGVAAPRMGRPHLSGLEDGHCAGARTAPWCRETYQLAGAHPQRLLGMAHLGLCDNF